MQSEHTMPASTPPAQHEASSDPYPWLHMQTPAIGEKISRLGHNFEWTEQHPSFDTLREMRSRGDDEVDLLLARLHVGFTADCMAVVAQRAHRHKARVTPSADDKAAALAAHATVAASSSACIPAIAEPSPDDIATDASCHAFLAKYSTVPAWVDWSKIAAAQVMYQRYGPSAQLALLYSSLVGGFGAPQISAVLEATGRLTRSCPQTYARLIETSLMILHCMGPTADTLQPLWTDDERLESATPPSPHRGEGWLACLRTRFLHAQVRSMLLKRTGASKWNTAIYGIPINAEDQLVTLLSFSFNVLRCLAHVGITLTSRESECYLHCWRYIGWLCGVDDRSLELYMTSFSASAAASESLFMHLVSPDKLSADLAKHVLQSVAENLSKRWSYNFHAALARYLLSDEWADELLLPASSSWQRCKVRALFAMMNSVNKISYWHPMLERFFCWMHYALPRRMVNRTFPRFVAKFEHCKSMMLASLHPFSAVEGIPHSITAIEDEEEKEAKMQCPFMRAQQQGLNGIQTTLVIPAGHPIVKARLPAARRPLAQGVARRSLPLRRCLPPSQWHRDPVFLFCMGFMLILLCSVSLPLSGACQRCS